jgi:hypothetical protein
VEIAVLVQTPKFRFGEHQNNRNIKHLKSGCMHAGAWYHPLGEQHLGSGLLLAYGHANTTTPTTPHFAQRTTFFVICFKAQFGCRRHCPFSMVLIFLRHGPPFERSKSELGSGICLELYSVLYGCVENWALSDMQIHSVN